jgi:uncharacterized membrane protein YgdD (TMEM256/DUF423 family)
METTVERRCGVDPVSANGDVASSRTPTPTKLERRSLMERRFLLLASLAGGLAVMLGAFGAHGLKGRVDPALLEVFDVGVRYHMYHALALLGLAALLSRRPTERLLQAAGWLFLAGMTLFSGSLYLLTLTGIRALGMITPLGGLAFIAGWLSMALAARKG